MVGLTPAEVAAYFGFTVWPREIWSFDLGGRRLDIIPTPGRQPAHIMIYDERTRLLLSGDMLYPGRLYAPSNRFEDFRESVDRLALFAQNHAIAHILGAHIEMTQDAGQGVALGAAAHPNEHVLELPTETLTRLQSVVHEMGDTVRRQQSETFIIFPQPPRARDPPGFEPASAAAPR